MASLQFSEGPSAPQPLLRRKQLLNHIVDGMAKARPSAVWAEIPRSITSYELGFRKITYRSLANAINGVAWWLHRSLGPSKDFETLAYFGSWDVRYIILLLGAVKVGYKVRSNSATTQTSYEFCRPTMCRWSFLLQSIAFQDWNIS